MDELVKLAISQANEATTDARLSDDTRAAVYYGNAAQTLLLMELLRQVAGLREDIKRSGVDA